MPPKLTAEQIEALYSYKVALARDDFLAYRKLINSNLKVNWFLSDLSRKLQNFYNDLVNGKRPKLIIQAPPQHGKSTAIIDFIAWLSGKHPELRTIYASFSERLGVRANLALQRTFERKVYKDIFPNLKVNDKRVVISQGYQKNKELIEYIETGGYFRNTTVQGSITGETLDLGVIDDPLKGRETANSMTFREKTWDWFTDDFFTRFDEKAGFLMILTRWHIDDPAGRMLKKGGFDVVTYKAIAEHDEEYRKKGEVLLPEHKSLEFLMERKNTMSPENFEALYQQNPIIKSGNLLKVDWLKYVGRSVVNKIRFEKRFITVDTALKDKEQNDYTVYTSFGFFENKLYMLDMFRGKPKSRERELTAKSFYKRNDEYPFSGMYIEQKASGIDLFQRMKSDGFMVYEVERNKDKVFRAEEISPYLEIHGLYIVDDIEHIDDFITEYTSFPSGVHDDMIDTVIDGFEIAYKNKSFDYGDLL